jgi:hypothetical protein
LLLLALLLAPAERRVLPAPAHSHPAATAPHPSPAAPAPQPQPQPQPQPTTTTTTTRPRQLPTRQPPPRRPGPQVNDLDFHQRGPSIEGCFSISRNDSYVLSTSGGSTSLFNLHSFQRLTRFYKPPPSAVVLGFHPHDNNLIALGLDDG